MRQYTLKFNDIRSRPARKQPDRVITFRVHDSDGYCGFDGTIIINGVGSTNARTEDELGRALVKQQQDHLNAANPANGLTDDDALDAIEAWLNDNQQVA